MSDIKGFKTATDWAKERGEGLISIGYEKSPELGTVARVPVAFYGKITLSFENGKLTMINQSQNIKPGVK